MRHGRMMHGMPLVARTLLILFLTSAGCATQPPGPATDSSQPSRPSQSTPRAAPQPPVNLSGYSAAFKQGYMDGCASARGAARRDEARYRQDTDYMMGWSDGHSICQRR